MKKLERDAGFGERATLLVERLLAATDEALYAWVRRLLAPAGGRGPGNRRTRVHAPGGGVPTGGGRPST